MNIKFHIKLQNMIKPQRGFTLAEVLITLGIIGVVAAMTIPTLMQKTQQKEFTTAFKKNYSVLLNAYNLSMNDNGVPSSWGLTDDQALNEQKLFDNLKPYLKILKVCGNSVDGCWPSEIYSFNNSWNGALNIISTRYWFTLQDGTSIGLLSTDHPDTDQQTFVIYIDVNGLKKPNTVGADIFQLGIINTGKISNYDPKTGVPDCYTDNFTCSAWVLSNDNEDYLKCTDLNWQTKLKCN